MLVGRNGRATYIGTTTDVRRTTTSPQYDLTPQMANIILDEIMNAVDNMGQPAAPRLNIAHAENMTQGSALHNFLQSYV